MSAPLAAITTAARSWRRRRRRREPPRPGSARLSERVIIALDAMGGDRAPDMVLKGASIASQRFPQVQYLVFGIESRIRPVLARLPRLAERTTVHHTDDVITGDTKPSAALRTGR